MTYETKVVLSAVAQFICKADTLEEAYDAVKEMANVEGLLLEPYEKKRKRKTTEESERG
jgi:hypothetical protein